MKFSSCACTFAFKSLRRKEDAKFEAAFAALL